VEVASDALAGDAIADDVFDAYFVSVFR
jgi:hypothetical protein